MSIDAASATSLLIQDIGQLAVVRPGPRRGREMRDVQFLSDAELLVRDGRIAWFGPRAEAPLDEGAVTLSAGGGTVIPGLIDAHTHIPFVGDRSSEFTRRLAGESYLDIMAAGGGIRATTAAVRSATAHELVVTNVPRLQRMLEAGVTRVECKTGYGLTPVDEQKQLEAIGLLDEQQPIDLVPTYLGAHALPAEYEGRSDDFIDAIGDAQLLRAIAESGRARFCDVFCDQGAFTVDQARRILTRARDAGLALKLHADELAQIGATRLAGELGATSADHLERIDDAGIAALRDAGTIAVVLPGTSFFLGIEHCDARRLMAADLPVAIATDYNPGSCMIESLPLVMNIACCQLKLLPVEVLTACTANAAAAIGCADEAGAIAAGHAADLVILDAPSLDEWFYTVGRPRVRAVVKAGQVVHRVTDHAR